MKTLKKKFSIYQSSQKVRKLWCDYSEAKSGIESPYSSSTTSAESREGDDYDAGASAFPPSLSSAGSIAAGQGPARALRAFVDAVDLTDARQAAVLQNLDDVGQGELVSTLIELARGLVGADDARGGSIPLSVTAGDVALAEKSLTVAQTCLAGTTTARQPTEWKEHLRHLVAILAAEEGAPDGQMLVPLDTEMCRRMLDVKAAALGVLKLVATDHEKVVGLGIYGGFQTIAHLALPRGSLLRPQAVELLALFLAIPRPDPESAARQEPRGRTGRWVGRFGGGSGGGGGASRSPRFSGDCCGEGEDEGGVAASSSSFADAASFVLSSFQALVSSGRDASEISSSATFGFPYSGAQGFPPGQLPMAVLPQSLMEEASRISALEAHRTALRDDPCPSVADSSCNSGDAGEGVGSGDGDGSAKPQKEQAGVADPGDVAEMMLADGVLAVLADVIAPCQAEGASGGDTHATESGAESSLNALDSESLRLEAFEAAVAMVEGRPNAQRDFVRLGGHSRICRLVHDVAERGKQSALHLPADSAAERSSRRSRSRSKPRADTSPGGEGQPVGELGTLDAAFDSVFRLALDGHTVAPGARADGVDTVRLLLALAARSPSLAVALRAARSLQALLHVRPMNAVSLERQDALEIAADAVAKLAFSDGGGGGGPCFGQALREDALFGLDGEVVVAERLAWSVDDKRAALSSMNDVVRVVAAVYSRRDARALERYAGILLASSTGRLGCDDTSLPGGTEAQRRRRCLSQGYRAAAAAAAAPGRTRDAGAPLARMDGESHAHVAARTTCEERKSGVQGTPPPPLPSPPRVDPDWAVEAGKVLMKAMAVMLDDRESFGLPPTPDRKSGCGVEWPEKKDDTTVLAGMLQIVQDELLEPLHPRPGSDAAVNDTGSADRLATAADRPHAAGEFCLSGWTEGWLLGALEIVARMVVRGDSGTVEALGAAGGWSLLAHIARLPSPPAHLLERSPSAAAEGHGTNPSGHGAGSAQGGEGDGERSNGRLLSEAWVGWVGARRLALWIIREALLTGTAGQCRGSNGSAGGTTLLVQPARWLVWLVRDLMKPTPPPCGDDPRAGACSAGQARDEVLMRLAVLNELRLAIGSFAPCEVVMEGCTRVLPLVALRAAQPKAPVAGGLGTGGDDEEVGGRTGVSPNRHPQARMGAANVKVVGRLAGDQRGVVLDSLVSEGVMEVLLAIVHENASSFSPGSRTAESGLALLLLADLAAGSEAAKVRLGTTLGYDTLAKAAHGAGVAIQAHQFSLWLEASLQRLGGVTSRLPPPFVCVATNPDDALASSDVSPTLKVARFGVGQGSSTGQEAGGAGGKARLGEESGERGRGESRDSRRRRGWRRRSPRRRGGSKDGIAWMPRSLPRLSHSVVGSRAESSAEGASEAHHMFDELWLPPGLVTLAQDVLLINRARGGVVVREEERYFIAQPRGAPTGGSGSVTSSDLGHPLWKPAVTKFRGLEAAVFPFLLLPLVPSEHKPQAAAQLSRLLDANPANAAALCHLRVPLALLKLGCRLPERKKQARDLYFHLSAQLMSHHISPADALELFHLASLQPSAWARLGRLRVTSGADLISARHAVGVSGLAAAQDGAPEIVDEVRVEHGVVLPPHAGELQMQLLYVIGTVVDSPAPAWFFHMDGGGGSGLVSEPLVRFPPKRVGYSLSMWLRPSRFSSGETALLSVCGRKNDGASRTLLRVSLRRCPGPGDSAAPPAAAAAGAVAAAGIGASLDDDGDLGAALDDACAKLQVHASMEQACSGQQPSGPSSSSGQAMDGGGGGGAAFAVASALVADPDVRCGRWQYLVLTHSNSPDAAGGGGGGGSRDQWMDGSITVYVDGKRRTLVTESAAAATAGGGGKSSRRTEKPAADHAPPPAYPAGAGGGSGSVSVSVGCWEEPSGGGCQQESSTASPPALDAAGLVNAAPAEARFSGQIATVALVEGAWSPETAKASFLRGPGAPPPGKRIIFASPGSLPPTPFLDPVEAAPSAPAVGEGGSGSSLDTKSIELQPAVGGDAPESGERELAEDHRSSGGQARAAVQRESSACTAPFSGVPPKTGAPPRDPMPRAGGQSPPFLAGDPPGMMLPLLSDTAVPPSRLSVNLAPVRKAIDVKYGVAPSDEPPAAGGTVFTTEEVAERRATGERTGGTYSVDREAAAGGVIPLSDSVALTVNSLAVAAGCGGKDKDSACDGRVSFRLAAGGGTGVYATTPLHAAVQAAGGFRLCLPFLRMDHARQVAALRVLAGLLEASAEGMDAFRVRDGFNVLYHALAQGHDALQQLSMDTFQTLFELMTSEALQGALDVSASNLSPVALLDAAGRTADDARATYLANGCTGTKPVRSPESLRLVVDLLGHCERKPDLQARVMEALVDALDGSFAGIQVWRRAFNESTAFAPLLYLLSPPAFAASDAASATRPTLDAALGGNAVAGALAASRRSASFSMPSSGPVGIATVAREDHSGGGGGGFKLKSVFTGERPAVAAGSAARTQAARMMQVLIAGSAAVAPVVRPQDPSSSVASSTSAGCTPDHLADLVGFVLRCHLEVEELTDIVRRQVLNTGQLAQDERYGVSPARRRFPEGSAQSQLALTRQVGGIVVDLLVQLCGGDGGAVVVGMMSQAFPAGGNFFVALELLSSSHVETRVSAIKLLSLMLVRKGDDGRRPSTSNFFSSDDSSTGGGARPGTDPQALRAFEKLGGFAAMGRQLELHITCQAVCDALMGMIFGAWGSKHEPRPIREKDVLAIKGNKESWLRAWWSSYSSPPDDEATNTTNHNCSANSMATGAAASTRSTTAEGCSSSSTSIVDRIRSTAVGATSSGSVPATSSVDQNGPEIVQPPDAGAPQTLAPALDTSWHEQEGGDEGTAVPEADQERRSGVAAATPAAATARTGGQGENNQAVNGEGAAVTTMTPPGSATKPGRFAALMKPKADTGGGAVAVGAETGAGDSSTGEKEDTSFLSGLFRRLSMEPSGGGDDKAAAAAEAAAAAAAATAAGGGGPRIFGKVFPPSSAERDAGVAATKKRTAAEKPASSSPPEEIFDPPLPTEATREAAARQAAEEDQPEQEHREETNGGDDSESLSLVLPEAVEVLMRALQRAQSPAVVSRCLLQLESAVAWLPAAGPAASESATGRNGGSGGGDDEGTGGSAFGKPSAGGGGGGGGGASRKRARNTDGGDRERNSDALMSRQGWLSWCQRLVEAFSARNDSGDLVPPPRRGGGHFGGYGGNDGADGGGGGGSDRWGGMGGSEVWEAGGYMDDSHSETTDTGSAFSYLESISMGQSVVPDGASGALEAFAGPVYGLVAALLEQDMARPARHKRGHRFRELFFLSNGKSFQVAVLEDALDAVQDSPMLSTEGVQSSRPASRAEGGGAAASLDARGEESVQRLESLRELLVAALHHHPDLPLGLCVKGVHTINLLGYHGSHEARSRMKSVGLLRARDDLIRRCLFHPVAAAWEIVSALSQVEDALETLVSQHGEKSGGEAETVAAGEVAVQLVHLFVEVTVAVLSQATTTTANGGSSSGGGGGGGGGGVSSPVARSNSAALAGRRATQVAAARALGRVAVASPVCRSTVIRLARHQQLLVRLLPALRCPLTIEEVEAIELGNIPEALPSLSGSSRWSLGSLSLLPTSTAPTSVSCMSDDAEGEQETLATQQTAAQSPQRNKTFFPSTPPPFNSAAAGSWPPSVPGGSMSSYFAASLGAVGGAADGTDGTSGGGGALAAKTPSAVAAVFAAAAGTPAAAAGAGAAGANPSSQFRLHEVLEEDEGEEQGRPASRVARGEEDTAVVAEEEAGAGSEPEASAFRRRPRRRSSSDISNGSVGGAGASGAVALPKSRPAGGGGGGGGSWHDPRGGGGRASDGFNVGGGWGLPEHHDLQTFVQWYSHDEQRDIRDGLRRRVSKTLAPLSKARDKAAGKQASKREKATRQAQKRELEASSAREKAATDALERCRAHAEKCSHRTTAAIDSWLTERRRRWEAGKTRCHELAPPVRSHVADGNAFDGGTNHVPAGEQAAAIPGAAVNAAAGLGGTQGGGMTPRDGKAPLSWDWGRDGGEGASFEDFFETFAGGDYDEGAGLP